MVAAWVTVDDLVDPTSPYASDAAEAASFVLFHLSGRKYGGVRTTTEVYCQMGLDQIGLSTYFGLHGYPQLPGPSGYQIIYPELQYGVIVNRVGGCCSSCGCTHLLRLRGAPLIEVTALRHGSRDLDPTDYDIYDHSFIAAPNRCWGTCDDIEVTYRYGTGPPALGKIAAKALADQYLLGMAGDDDCVLPQRVTQITRQGESWTLLDPQEFLDKGRTGIYQVDLFLATINPDGARLRSRVFSPDLMRGKTRRSSIAPPAPPAPGGLVVTPGSFGTFSAPSPSPMMMAAPPVSPSSTSSGVTVPVYSGRPLRWVVPGSFTEASPPVVVVQPSGEQLPSSALSWRSGNFTVDLTSDEAERLLPSGSTLSVSSTASDGSTTGQASYSVERRTP